MSGDDVSFLSAKLDTVSNDVNEIKVDVKSLTQDLGKLALAVARDNVTWDGYDRRAEITKREIELAEKRAIERTDQLGEWLRWVFYLSLLAVLGLLGVVGSLVARGKV